MQNTSTVDVAVIGGAAAGLSAALMLARSRRSVVVIDAGAPRNAPADGVHGFLTRDGLPPAELVATGRREVRSYGGVVVEGTATGARRTDTGSFVVEVEGREPVTARRIVVASGVVDELPDVDGLAQRWGRDVVHCPYCHGWEVRDQAIGVLGTNRMAVHATMLFRQLSDRVTLFRHTAAPLDDEQLDQLAARGVRVVDGPVERVHVVDDRIAGLRLRGGEIVALDVVAVSTRLVPRSPVLDALGLTAVPHPLGADIGSTYPTVDPSGATSVPGVWVAGNVTDPFAQVVTAAAQGAVAGAAVNADLAGEDTRTAVAARGSLGTCTVINSPARGTGSPQPA